MIIDNYVILIDIIMENLAHYHKNPISHTNSRHSDISFTHEVNHLTRLDLYVRMARKIN